jgi:hypothetical protein
MTLIGSKPSHAPSYVFHLNFKCNEKENKIKFTCELYL